MKKIVFALVVLASSAAFAKATKKEVVINPADMKWTEVAKGAHQTVLWGDPTKGAHGVITKFDAGTVHPMHTHSSELKLVILSGGYWSQIEGQPKVVAETGGYMSVPAGVKHTSGCEGTTECSFLQTSNGKFDIHFIEGQQPASR